MEIYKPIVLQGISVLSLLVFFFLSVLKKAPPLKVLFTVILLFLVYAVFINRDYSANIDLPLYMGFYEFNVDFSDIFTSSTAWKGDFFFFAFMPLAHMMGLGAEGYLTFQLILSVGLMFYAYYLFFKDTKALLFLALFFMLNSSSFYLTQGNVIRQGFASSLLILAFSIPTRKLTNVFKVLAFFSHKGAVMAFFAPLVNFKDIQRLMVLVLAFVLGYFNVFVQLLNLLPLPEFVATKLEFYASFERASSNSFIKLVLLVLFNLFFLKFRHRQGAYAKAYSFFFVFSLAALLLYPFDGMFSRLILYTDAFMPIVAVGAIYQFNQQNNRLWSAMAMASLSLLYSIYVFNHESILFNMGEFFRL